VFRITKVGTVGRLLRTGWLRQARQRYPLVARQRRRPYREGRHLKRFKNDASEVRADLSAASRWRISMTSSRAISSRPLHGKSRARSLRLKAYGSSVHGALTLELRIEDAHSLKDKRHVVRGLKDRLRHKFNVSVAEIGSQDVWQHAVSR